MSRRAPQRGAALLTAMLTVTLVTTFASAMLWQQWRSFEVEAAERARSQQGWVLTGALDWARLILREDARSGPVDHLSEPWAVPLQEVGLSGFLAMDRSHVEDGPEAFLSGQISDLQARMNVRNLVSDGRVSVPARLAFGRLFTLLHLPESQLDTLAENLRLASNADVVQASALLPPQRMAQLSWLGLPIQTLKTIEPYVTLLPVSTPVNLNTASAEVIHASIPGLDMTQAQRLVTLRTASHFRSVADALREAQVSPTAAATAQLSVSSRFFEIDGRLRLDSTTVQERSVVEREDQEVRVLWRERTVAQTTAAPRPLSARP